MDIDIDPKAAAGPSTQQQLKGTKLTRLCDAQSEHFYIYLTVEMELQQGSSKKPAAGAYQLSILTFRKMLSSALQDLFGQAMGGGINIDILGFWTDETKDPYNSLLFAPKTSVASTPSIPSPALSTAAPTTAAVSTTESEATVALSSRSSVSITSTYSSLTAASAILRCHSLDFNQLWNALMLFNTLVDDYESRFEVRYVSSTLLGLQANSRQLKWPN